MKLAFLVALAATPAFAAEADDAPRPNVLWLIAEDMSPDLSCYGGQADTPNLDRLAERGMRFTHAFTTAPVCSASRSALMTGMYQTAIGANNHRSHRSNVPVDGPNRLPSHVRTLPDRLRDAGYHTANVRRIFSPDSPHGWVQGTGKTDWNFARGADEPNRPFDSAEWASLTANQPFYAQVNFSETHRGGAWDKAHTRIASPIDPADVTLPPYEPDHPVVRADRAQYLNAVMALDVKVGHVLDKLEADGLADDTIVVFFSDHGEAHVRGKQWCYDSGLHVPLIVAWPEGLEPPAEYKAGSVSDRIVEAIDLTATTLALCGVEKPAGMQGRVLFGPQAEPAPEYAFAARDRCDETTFRIRTLRGPRFRYIRNALPERPFLLSNRYKEMSYPAVPLMRKLYAEGKLTTPQARLASPEPRPAEELYDLDADPDEVTNLADDPAHAETLATMRAALDERLREADRTTEIEPWPVVQGWLDYAMNKRGEDWTAGLRSKFPSVYPLDERFAVETYRDQHPAE